MESKKPEVKLGDCNVVGCDRERAQLDKSGMCWTCRILKDRGQLRRDAKGRWYRAEVWDAECEREARVLLAEFSADAKSGASKAGAVAGSGPKPTAKAKPQAATARAVKTVKGKQGASLGKSGKTAKAKTKTQAARPSAEAALAGFDFVPFDSGTRMRMPLVHLRKNRDLGFSRQAVRDFGLTAYGFVTLAYDATRRTILVRMHDEPVQGALKLTSSNRMRCVSGVGFCKRFGIEDEGSFLMEAVNGVDGVFLVRLGECVKAAA
jgi:hypothetical protein